MDQRGFGMAQAKAMTQRNAVELREEIINELPDGEEWLETPHLMLSGRTPEQAISDGDLDAVQNLLYSILYVGAV
jgi:hypothetical protein